MAFGVSPFGFGTGDDAPEPPTGVWGSRYINPQTGDYVTDVSSGQLQQMPPVRQRFLIKLKTRLGSSSVQPLLGIQLPQKLDASTERQIDDAVRVAMHQETAVEKIALIQSVTLTRDTGNTGRAFIVVSYKDLTTGLSDQVSF